MKFQVLLLIGLLVLTFGQPIPDPEDFKKSIENAVSTEQNHQNVELSELKSVLIDDDKIEVLRPTGSFDEWKHIDEVTDKEQPDVIIESIRAVRNAEVEQESTTFVVTKSAGEKDESTTQAIVNGKKMESDESKESNESTKESVESKEEQSS